MNNKVLIKLIVPEINQKFGLKIINCIHTRFM